MTAAATVVRLKHPDPLGPACVVAPDGRERTVVGCKAAALVLDGNPWGLTPRPAAEPLAKGVTGATLCRAADQAGTRLGTLDPAAWVALAAGCDVPAVEMRPGKVDCRECDGAGEVTCHACDRDHECDECDGTGEVDGDPAPTDVWPEPVFVAAAGDEYDLQLIAPLLRLVPPGVGVAESRVHRLFLSGPGWRLVAASVSRPVPVPPAVPWTFTPGGDR